MRGACVQRSREELNRQVLSQHSLREVVLDSDSFPSHAVSALVLSKLILPPSMSASSHAPACVSGFYLLQSLSLQIVLLKMQIDHSPLLLGSCWQLPRLQHSSSQLPAGLRSLPRALLQLPLLRWSSSTPGSFLPQCLRTWWPFCLGCSPLGSRQANLSSSGCSLISDRAFGSDEHVSEVTPIWSLLPAPVLFIQRACLNSECTCYLFTCFLSVSPARMEALAS